MFAHKIQIYKRNVRWNTVCLYATQHVNKTLFKVMFRYCEHRQSHADTDRYKNETSSSGHLNCRVDLRNTVTSTQLHQMCVPPLKRAVSATVVQSSKRTVADRHRLAAHHNKHCWRAFRRYQHRWPWTTLNPRNIILSNLLRDFRLPHTLQEWTAPISLEIDQDNMCMKFSALNVDFNSAVKYSYIDRVRL